LKCECESAAHIVVVVWIVGLCAGMADRWCPAFIMEAGAKGYTAVHLYPVRVREHGAVLHASTMARERLAVYI